MPLVSKIDNRQTVSLSDSKANEGKQSDAAEEGDGGHDSARTTGLTGNEGLQGLGKGIATRPEESP